MMNKILVKARDGTHLACHQFSCEQPKARIFCLHGSSLNTRRYVGLARSCQQAGYEMVVCDLRGHGESEGARGTCQYKGQFEDDLFDVISRFNESHSLTTILGGHSAGAVISLRYIQKYGQQQISGSYFISPALTNFMEAARFDSDISRVSFVLRFWRKKPTFTPIPEVARKHLPRINNGLFWLAYLLPFLRHRTAMKFSAVEKIAKLEGRVLNYSFNSMISVSIDDYVSIFRQMKVPVLFISGDQDEFLSPQFLPTVAQWHLAPDLDKEVHILPKVRHMTVINAASKVLVNWLTQRWGNTKNSNPGEFNTRELNTIESNTGETAA